MAFTLKELTDAEKEAFVKDNYWGIVSFAGDEPYALPMGYRYIKGDVILGFVSAGRKMSYVNKSRNVCFTICQPTAQSPDPKEAYPFTSVIIEGELEEITDRAYYGLKPLPEGVKVASFRIKQKIVGTLKLGLNY
jgi:nitroimidazol reductase NimA-like FMN-containing flavoprotein (pyridoxamine 5'-phosphate oxidase superfamily)